MGLTRRTLALLVCFIHVGEGGSASSPVVSLNHGAGAAEGFSRKFFVPVSACPFTGLDAIPLVNKVVAELLTDGRMEEGLSCLEGVLQEHQRGVVELGAEALDVIRGNAAVLQQALAPYSRKRFIHQLEGGEWPPPWDVRLQPAAANGSDPAIYVGEGFLTQAQCSAAIDLFERSALFQGNLFSNGKVVTRLDQKNRWEYDVSAEERDSEWCALDRLLAQVMVRALFHYERANPVLRTLHTPFIDEGFRMIRYHATNATRRKAQPELHLWHHDGNHEPLGTPARILAGIIYLSEPEVGGDTAFLYRNLRVKPKCGRVLIFPAAYPYVHSGQPVRKGVKYAAVVQVQANPPRPQ